MTLLEAPVPWAPHEYQKNAVKFLLQHPHGALFLDPGLGKTSIVLEAMKLLKHRDMMTGALVIAPLRVCHSVWPAEVAKWLNFAGLTIEILHGPHKAKALASKADIYCINPEGLQWLMAQNDFKRRRFDVLVVDESSKFKASNTLRFRTLKRSLGKFARRWILTGTPAPNGIGDLFSQVYLLDQGAALGQYVTQFRKEYFLPVGYDWRLQDDAEVRIQEKLKPISLSLSARDYLELPEEITKTTWVELPPAARRVYNALETQFLVTLDSGERVTALSAAVAAGKCRQVANGALYLEEVPTHKTVGSTRQYEAIHTEKLDALCDLIEECAGQPVLVAYEFEHDLRRLRERLGATTPYIGGGVSMAQTRQIVAAWNAGQIPVLLGQPQAMAHGLNMQGGGNHVVWFSLPWNLELYLQFNQRVLRQGSKHPHVFVYHLAARKTVDVMILAALRSKRRTQKTLLDALKVYVRGVQK